MTSFLPVRPNNLKVVGIVSTLYLVTVLFGSFLVYMVAVFVVIPHLCVTIHHHELAAHIWASIRLVKMRNVRLQLIIRIRVRQYRGDAPNDIEYNQFSSSFSIVHEGDHWHTFVRKLIKG